MKIDLEAWRQAVDCRDAAEGTLASLADCINQELRETGGCDAHQIKNYLDTGEMRRAVTALVDMHRARLEAVEREAREYKYEWEMAVEGESRSQARRPR